MNRGLLTNHGGSPINKPEAVRNNLTKGLLE